MQALKGLVVGLGVLIVIGVVLLAYGFYTKLSDPTVKLLKSADDRESPSPQGFNEARISLPEGCTLLEMRPDGDRLYLRTGPTGLCERVIVVDTTTGAVVGTILVKP